MNEQCIEKLKVPEIKLESCILRLYILPFPAGALTVSYLPHNVTDGDWHSLTWSYTATHLMASIDGSASETVALAAGSGEPLPVGSGSGVGLSPQAAIYLGGLPEDLQLPQGMLASSNPSSDSLHHWKH